MSGHDGLLLGVDVGGTKIAGVAVETVGGTLRAEHRQPLDGAPLEAQVAGLARRLLEQAGSGSAEAVGIAVPGLVDAGTGVMRLAVNVEVGELAIGPLVEAALGAPCYVEHDARAAALWLIEQRGERESLAYLSVGTGISAAVVIDGRLVRGVNGLAGEIGHTRAIENGPQCSCGLEGCLETVAAGPALTRMAAEAVERGERTALSADAAPAEVYRHAAAGDAVASAIAAEVGAHLARAIRTLALLYGVDRVVIGGGLSRAGATFVQPILDELERERLASPLMAHALGSLPVELLPPESDPGAWGAVSVARMRRAHDPHRPLEGEVADG
jgi:predicted NBD/HSP70 family sugar kinase